MEEDEEEEELDYEEAKPPSCKCAALVVLPSREHKAVVIDALRKKNSTPVKSVPVPGWSAQVSVFVGNDSSAYGVTVSMAAEPRARMNNLPRLAKETGCTLLVLVNPGYTVDDLKRRRIELPVECSCFFAAESEFMCDVLDAGPAIRNLLRPVFGEPVPVAPAPPPPVIDVDDDDDGLDRMVADFGQVRGISGERRYRRILTGEDDDAADEEENVDEIIAKAERDFQELERREAAAAAAASRGGGGGQISINSNSVIIMRGDGPPPSRRDVQNFVSSRVNGGLVAPRRNRSDPPNRVFAAPPPPPPPPRRVAVGPPNRRSIAVARAQEEQTRAQLSNLARRAADSNTANERVKEMVKPREEESGLLAMATTAASNTCIICASNHVTTMVLPCRHTLFCYKCITVWIEQAHNCPSCRGNVDTAIQMITNTDVNTESKKRLLDPVYANTVADELCKDAEEIRKRSKKEPVLEKK